MLHGTHVCLWSFFIYFFNLRNTGLIENFFPASLLKIFRQPVKARFLALTFVSHEMLGELRGVVYQ